MLTGGVWNCAPTIGPTIGLALGCGARHNGNVVIQISRRR
jgi:hypothetical protein